MQMDDTTHLLLHRKGREPQWNCHPIGNYSNEAVFSAGGRKKKERDRL
jgi:hypothetical protein